MNVTNQELYELKMPQVIIEDTTKPVRWGATTEEMNKSTLDSMYRVQEAIYRLFGECDMRETLANTINPAQSNMFLPLKQWNINLGGCFVEVSIMQRVLDGCFAEMRVLV